MSDKEWLAQLKAGDEVLIRNGGATERLAVVDKTTATQIVIGKDRYDRDRGGLRGATSWGRLYISKPTDADRDRIARTVACQTIQMRFMNGRHSKLPTAELVAFAARIKETDLAAAQAAQDAS